MSVTVESESFVVDTNTGTAEQVMADLQTGDATLQKDPDSATAAAPSEPVPTEASDAGKALANRKRSLEGRKQTIQDEINALVRQRGDTQRERDAIARELESLRAEKARLSAPQASMPMAAATQPVPPASDDQEPTEEQFSDYASYVKAQARWQAREAIRAFQEETRQQQAAHSRQQWQQSRDQQFAERLTEAASRIPDFNVLVNREDIELSPPMVDAIKESPVAAELMVHMAHYPEDAQRIAALHPVLAFGEMKKLEARLEIASGRGSSTPAFTFSKAKPPIRPVGSAPSRTVDDATDMDFGPEYVRRMNTQERKARRY
jgi:hypothetical protein